MYLQTVKKNIVSPLWVMSLSYRNKNLTAEQFTQLLGGSSSKSGSTQPSDSTPGRQNSTAGAQQTPTAGAQQTPTTGTHGTTPGTQSTTPDKSNGSVGTGTVNSGSSDMNSTLQAALTVALLAMIKQMVPEAVKEQPKTDKSKTAKNDDKRKNGDRKVNDDE